MSQEGLTMLEDEMSFCVWPEGWRWGAWHCPVGRQRRNTLQAGLAVLLPLLFLGSFPGAVAADEEVVAKTAPLDKRVDAATVRATEYLWKTRKFGLVWPGGRGLPQQSSRISAPS